MTVLVIAEHDHSTLRPATLNTVAAAREINLFSDGQIHVLVAGSGSQSAAAMTSRIQGVAKVVHADAMCLADGLAENVAAQVLARPLQSSTSPAANRHW